MADQEHFAQLKEGPEAWNRWRNEHAGVSPDLSGANLNGVDLERADLRGAQLSRATFLGAYLSGAHLSGADLTQANLGAASLNGANLAGTLLGRADLTRANLTRADLSGADLSGADLHEANFNRAELHWAYLDGANLRRTILSRANLSGADLRRADLSEARLNQTVFGAASLSEVKGLDTCLHLGPSIIDYGTLARSGPLPLAFLRGCGLSDQLIGYLPTLLSQAIQFFSCFISYSTKDQEFAERLYSDLQNNSVRCWFAPHKMQGGKKTHEQIDEAIRLYDRLLLILSEHSMESKWVRTEIAKARRREVREKRRMLFPVSLVDFETLCKWECFDTDTGEDHAGEIREYAVPNFSNWKKHGSYQEQFDHLLRDLHAIVDADSR